MSIPICFHKDRRIQTAMERAATEEYRRTNNMTTYETLVNMRWQYLAALIEVQACYNEPDYPEACEWLNEIGQFLEDAQERYDREGLNFMENN